MEKNYSALARKHLSDSEKYGISFKDAVFQIMHMAEDFSDSDIMEAFELLPDEARNVALEKIEAYKQTGEYHVISSTGTSRDLSALMARLSNLL